MQNFSLPSFLVNRRWILFFCGMILLIPQPVLGQEFPMEVVSQTTPGFTADFLSRVLFRDQDITVMSGKIYAVPPKVRFEPQLEEEEDENYREVQLYDFEQQRLQRVFLDDKIFFQIELTEKSRLKAMRDGWIPWEDPSRIARRKIKLKEDFTNDRPCILYLQERRIDNAKDKKSPSTFLEYSLIWEATDLPGLAVRIIYFLSNQATVVVDYKNAKLTDLDPAVFQPPEGFVNLSPF